MTLFLARFLRTLTVAGVALAVACDRQAAGPRYHLAVVPESLAFVAREGGLVPIPRFVTVTGTGAGNWLVGADAAWLAVASGSGSIPSAVLVSPSSQGLALGTHRGVLTFTSPSAWNSPVRVNVRLDIVSRSPLAGRWVGAWDALVLSLELRDSASAVVGSGEIAVGSVPLSVSGTRTGDNLALSLRPATGSAITLNAFFYGDHVLRGALTGGGFAGDSVLLFRQ